MSHTRISSSFTPGSWTVAYYAKTNREGSASHYSVKLRDKTIVRTMTHVATDEDKANARLIAAATTLLEALKEVRVDYRQCGMADRQIMAIMNTAIAHAEKKDT